MGSKGNVKEFFWHAFCLACPRILLGFECFAGAWQRHLLQRFSTVFGAGDSIPFRAFRLARLVLQKHSKLWVPKVTWKSFFWHAFCLACPRRLDGVDWLKSREDSKILFVSWQNKHSKKIASPAHQIKAYCISRAASALNHIPKNLRPWQSSPTWRSTAYVMTDVLIRDLTSNISTNRNIMHYDWFEWFKFDRIWFTVPHHKPHSIRWHANSVGVPCPFPLKLPWTEFSTQTSYPSAEVSAKVRYPAESVLQTCQSTIRDQVENFDYFA